MIIDLDRDKFSNLLDIFELICKLCSDVSIINGRIRQPSDRKTSIFDINLTDLFNIDNIPTIYLTGIASKIGIFNPFKNQKRDVKIAIEDTRYVFSDDFTNIILTKPLERYMSNPYINEEDFKLKLDLSDDGIIFEKVLDKMLIDRLSAYHRFVSASSIRIECRNNMAQFCVSAQDTSSSATNISLPKLQLNKDINCDYSFTMMPFLLSDSCVELKGYIRNDDKIVINLNMEMGDIPISVWVLGTMITSEDI